MKINKYFKASNIFFLLILLFFFTNKTFTQTDDSLYYLNPDYHVAKELFNRRIVMLGDYGHNQPGPYKLVYDVLENWFKICEKKQESVNLTYIIECDSHLVDELDKFIVSGDIEPLIDSISPDFFLEDLEYFIQLRNFWNRVDSVNQNRKNKLSFKVKGYEEETWKLSSFSQKEWELWFINERDSNIASGIVDYMKSNPDEQILMFYGTGHLQNAYVNKNFNFKDISEKESMGYYLGYYLKKEFGYESIITYYTINYSDDLVKNPEFENFKMKDFITRSYNLNNPFWQYNKNWDYMFVCHSTIVQNIDARFICSRFITEKTIKEINVIKSFLPGFIAKQTYRHSFHNLYYITGVKFINDTILNDWIKSNNFNETGWLYDNRLSDTILAFISRIPNDKFKAIFSDYYILLFSKYGISTEAIDTTKAYLENEKWKNYDFPNLMNRIKFTNSIGIYWFGYPDEKIKAKEYLVQFSGEDFAEPEKYLQWYRMKYFGFDY